MEGELEPAELERIESARQDPRMVKLREAIFGVVRTVVEIWSADAGVGQVGGSDIFVKFRVRSVCFMTKRRP